MENVIGLTRVKHGVFDQKRRRLDCVDVQACPSIDCSRCDKFQNLMCWFSYPGNNID